MNMTDEARAYHRQRAEEIFAATEENRQYIEQAQAVIRNANSTAKILNYGRGDE